MQPPGDSTLRQGRSSIRVCGLQADAAGRRGTRLAFACELCAALMTGVRGSGSCNLTKGVRASLVTGACKTACLLSVTFLAGQICFASCRIQRLPHSADMQIQASTVIHRAWGKTLYKIQSRSISPDNDEEWQSLG